MANVLFRTAIASSASTFQLTVPGFGTPKAVMLFCTNAQSLNGDETSNLMSIGFTDGVNNFASMSYTTNGVADANVVSKQSNDSCLGFINQNNVAQQWAFSQWVTDGVELTTVSGSSASREVVAVLIGGQDVDEVLAFDHTLNANASQSVSLGFQPDLVLFGGTCKKDYLRSNEAVNNIGYTFNDGTQRNRGYSLGSLHGETTMANSAWRSSDSVLYYTLDGTTFLSAAVSAFTGTGFDLSLTGTDFNGRIFQGLGIKFTANKPQIATPSSNFSSGGNGTWSPGFEADFCLMPLVIAPSLNSAGVNDVYGFNIAPHDVDNGYTLSCYDEDSATIANSGSRTSSSLTFVNDTGAVDVAVSGYVFGATDVVYTTTTSPASNRPTIPLYIEKATAPAVTFDGPDIVAQTGTENQVFSFDENGEGTVASRFSGGGSTADVQIRTTDFFTSAVGAGATLDITIPGMGFTPTAAIFLWSSANAADYNQRAGYWYSIGFATASDAQGNISTSKTNAGATSSTARGRRTDAVLDVPNSGANSVQLTTFIPDGCTLTYEQSHSGGPRHGQVIFIGGVDVVNASIVNNQSANTTSPETVTFGFEPDLVFCASCGLAVASGGFATADMSFGAALNKAGLPQSGIATRETDGETQTKIGGYLSSTSFQPRLADGPPVAFSLTHSVSQFTATGIEVTSTLANQNNYLYLALEFANDPDIDIVNTQIPTSGNWVENFGFEPAFGMMVTGHGISAVDTINTNSVESFTITTFDSVTAKSMGVSSVADAETTSTGYILASSKLLATTPDGTTEAESSAYSLTPTGWDFTLTTNPTAPLLGWALAIGQGSGAPLTYALSPDSDALPTGLTVNATTGNIEGTPTEVATRNIIIFAKSGCS
jgi:hypothetical protein